MYDASQILAATGLYTRIGFREPTKTGYTGILDASAKTTKSGMTYDYFHTLADFVNLYDCQQDAGISNVNVNALVASMQKEAIEVGLKLVFSGQRDLIQSELQFKKQNRFEDKIAAGSNFVGFEITVPETGNIVNVLNNVTLQFDGAQSLTLYLFHSSKKAAVATFAATLVADDFYKLSLDQKLFNKASTYGPGKFYFGYFQSDLTTQAYDRVWNGAGIRTGFNCVSLRSISATPNGVTMFDTDTIQYRSECWGINLDISSYNDYTNLIINNQALFDGVQGYCLAIQMLELIRTTGRINNTVRGLAELANLANNDLSDQVEPKSLGLYTKRTIEVNRVRKSLFNDDLITVIR